MSFTHEDRLRRERSFLLNALNSVINEIESVPGTDATLARQWLKEYRELSTGLRGTVAATQNFIEHDDERFTVGQKWLDRGGSGNTAVIDTVEKVNGVEPYCYLIHYRVGDWTYYCSLFEFQAKFVHNGER